jgi:hypothetical protein
VCIYFEGINSFSLVSAVSLDINPTTAVAAVDNVYTAAREHRIRIMEWCRIRSELQKQIYQEKKDSGHYGQKTLVQLGQHD